MIDARYEVFASSGGDADSTITTLTGWSAEETAVTPGPAVIYLREGSASGDVIVRINLAGDETSGESYFHPICRKPNGSLIENIFVDFVSGTSSITLYGR